MEGADSQGGGAQPQIAIPAIHNLTPPGPLDIDGPGARGRWKDFKDEWNRYSLLSGLTRQSKIFQKELLLHQIGKGGRRIHESFVFAGDEDKEDPQVLIAKYDTHFGAACVEHIERIKFYNRDQLPDETFEQFLSDIRILLKDGGSCNCMYDKLLMDRIFLGHKDPKVKDKLYGLENPNLSTTLNICRTMEVTHENKKVFKTESATVNKVSHKKYLDKCKYCGKKHKWQKEECPAWGKSCVVCKESNHFAGSEMCDGKKSHKKDKKEKKQRSHKYTQKKQRDVYAVDEDSESDFESASDSSSAEGSICAVVSSVSDPRSRPLYCKINIDNETVVHQIDPGATVCVLPAKHIGSRFIRPEQIGLKMWNGNTVSALGKCKIKVQNEKTGEKWNIDYVIVDDKRLTPLLSRKAAEMMGLITVNYHNFDLANKVTHRKTLEDFISEFPSVFDGKPGSLPGEKVHLTLTSEAEPVIKPARTLPESLKDAVKAQLEDKVKAGILAKVDEPTDYVNQMAVAEKKNGDPRICLDPRPLNLGLKREHYRLPVLEDILPELAGAKVFSVIDLKEGYIHCELDYDSSLLTTMATPFGRYRWCRLPFGLNVSSEIFQKRLVQSLEGLKKVKCIADDLIVWGDDDPDHDEAFYNLMLTFAKNNTKANLDKIQFRQEAVKFYGHIVSNEGLKPEPEKVQGITDLKVPEDVKAVERLKGMVGYLSRFVPNLSDVMRPISMLTGKNVAWTWDATQDKAFTVLKKLLSEAPALAYFDAKKELTIQTDASGDGLGAAMIQEDQPIAYASRALSGAETRYSTIEKEMLAVVFALEKWHQFTYGRHVTIYSDHKPLQAISKKPLDKAPKRLQGMLLRALAYDIDIIYRQGKQMYLADTLSRAHPPPSDKSEEMEFERINAVTYISMSPERIQQIRDATKTDTVLATLQNTIQTGWPDRKDVPGPIVEYYSFRDELQVTDGLIFRGERLVIPKSLKNSILKDIHRGHSGMDACLRLAREYVYWPGMSNDIKEVVRLCEVCRELEVSHAKETLLNHDVPDRPWQKLGGDLFDFEGDKYMITVDYFSNFWELDRMYSTTAKVIIRKLKTHFARYGIPDEMIVDSGSQYTSDEFQQFCKEWGIKLTLTPPHHHQANGKAESAVKSAKRLLRKTKRTGEDPYLALCTHRNTPQQGIGLSPAQRLFCRRTKTLLPTATTLLKPQTDTTHTVKKLKDNQQRQKSYYDKAAKDLPNLDKGDCVRVKPYRLGDKTWKKARVVEKLDRRLYEVEFEDGKRLRRNRRMLRKSHEPPPPPRHVSLSPPRHRPRSLSPPVVRYRSWSPPQRRPPSPGDKTAGHLPSAPPDGSIADLPAQPHEEANNDSVGLRRSKRERKTPKRFPDI